jgi:hypothetical protein
LNGQGNRREGRLILTIRKRPRTKDDDEDDWAKFSSPSGPDIDRQFSVTASTGFEGALRLILRQGLLKDLKKHIRHLCSGERRHTVEDKEGNSLQPKL